MNDLKTDAGAAIDSLNGLDSLLTESVSAMGSPIWIDIIYLVLAFAVFFLVKWIISIIELKSSVQLWNRGILPAILRIVLILFIFRIITTGVIKLDPGDYLITLLVFSSIAFLAIYPQIFNFFCGIILSINRSLHIGDIIEIDNTQGEVLKLNPLSVVIRTDYNSTDYIPNGHFFKYMYKNITNHNSPHFVVFQYPLSGKPDFEKLRTFAMETALSAPYIDLKEKTEVFFSQDEQGNPLMTLNAFIENPQDEQAFVSYLVENFYSDGRAG